jgi:hypothetical protein
MNVFLKTHEGKNCLIDFVGSMCNHMTNQCTFRQRSNNEIIHASTSRGYYSFYTTKNKRKEIKTNSPYLVGDGKSPNVCISLAITPACTTYTKHPGDLAITQMP